MTAITAILIDSVRQLRAKRLFWIVLAISALIFVAYGSIGFTPTGVSIGYGIWDFENEYVREGTIYSRLLLEGIFTSLIVPLWFTWGAIILALVSTADIFPDFLAKGSIDLVVSKPVSRITIFITKYVGALLFVFAQIAIFTTGVFLVLGLRIDEWRWPVFAAIPIVLAVFSYLYAIMVLLNLLTRSALASMLITFIVWLGLFSLQTTEGILNTVRLGAEQQVQATEDRLERLDRMILLAEQSRRDRLTADWKSQAETLRAELPDLLEREKTWQTWHGGFRVALNFLPKPQETVGILQRTLEADDDEGASADLAVVMQALTENRLPEADEERMSTREAFESLPEEEQLERADEYLAEAPERREPFDESQNEALQEDYRARSAAFILTTSLGFELFILAIAGWYFSRRDF